MDVPERSNRTGRSFAPVTTIFYRLDRKSLASLMRGAPEYLSLADTSQRLSKLCKRQFIFKQTVSFRDTTNFYSNTSSPASPLVQPQLYTRPSNPPLHKTSKNVLSFITKLSHLTPTLSDISKEPKGDDTNERVRSEYTRREHAE